MDSKSWVVCFVIVFVGVFLAIEASGKLQRAREAEQLEQINKQLAAQAA